MRLQKPWMWFVGCALPALVLVALFILGANYYSRWKNTPAFRVAQAQLERASQREVVIYREGGFPRFVGMQVAAEGQDEVAQATKFLDTYSALYFQTDMDSELIVQRVSQPNTIGGVYVDLVQQYRGLPVFGAELVVQVLGEHIVSTNGALLSGELEIDTRPSLLPGDALELAVKELGLTDPQTIGESALVIFDPSLLDEQVQPAPQLAWRITMAEPVQRQLIVDADSGDLLLNMPRAAFHGGAHGGISFELDTANNENTSSCWADTTDDDEIGDQSYFDDDYNGNADAVEAYANYFDVYAFYHQNFNWHSYDGGGSEMEIYINVPTASMNGAPAAWSVNCSDMRFQNGNADLDSMTHEFTHGVIVHTSNLLFSGHPGALHEAFADVMAGINAGFPGYMDNPGLTDFPGCGRDWADHMDNYYNGSCDFGGVHINSTIISHPAFRMATGDKAGVRYDLGGGDVIQLDVPEMGNGKVMALYFSVMTSLPSNASFYTTANALIDTAKLFEANGSQGFTIDDVCSVNNALFATGLADPDFDCDGVVGIEDPDEDGDGIPDIFDSCPLEENLGQDYDLDFIDDACDPFVDNDIDNDGILNSEDNCPRDYNPNQENSDEHLEGPGTYAPLMGDACDPDADGDGISTDNDNCPFVPNPGQENSDTDFAGDACDEWAHCDDVVAWTDPPWPLDPEPYSPDENHNGIPDACEIFISVWEGDGSLSYLPGYGPGSGNNNNNNDDNAGRLPPGKLQAVAIESDNNSYTQIPVEICSDPDGWYGPDWRHVVQVDGLSLEVKPRIINSEGAMVAHSRSANGSHYLPFAPQGDEQYFLLFYQPPGEASTIAFDYAYDCGPDDTLDYPRPLADGLPLSEENEEPQEEQATVTPTPTLQACNYTALVNLFCRVGPGQVYPEIDSFVPDTQADVIGISPDSSHVQVIGPNFGEACYVPVGEQFGELNGACDNLEVVQPPPTPTHTPTPTPEPEPTATPVPPQPSIPQCDDNIDNDGDGAIDLRDKQCTDPSDNDESQ